MAEPNTTTLDEDLLAAMRQARTAFLTRIEPLRPDLHRYCRALTGNPWDAEDLVQDVLAKALTRGAGTHHVVDRPLPWLIRIATNAYIDTYRKRLPVPAEPVDSPGPEQTDRLEVRDALNGLVTLLPPQERAAVVLREAFELPLAEIAGMLETSVGAVKAALHRGRGKLSGEVPAPPRTKPSRALLDQLADAFTSYDLDRLTALFLAEGVSDVVGQVIEVGRENVRNGSLHHTLVLEPVRYRAEVRELEGEPMVLMWASADDKPEAVEDVLRISEADGQVACLRWYYFCPETIAEVAARLGVPARTHGYRHGVS